ncbi:MAG: hypothetical protein U0836_10915 [Pirellulales bacterium]
MKAASFSLRTIFLVVAVAALGIAALVNANDWWTVAVTTTTVLLLVAATIAAGNPFYRGFCVMGWAYFLLTTGATAVGTDTLLLPTRIMMMAVPQPQQPPGWERASPAYLSVSVAMSGATSDPSDPNAIQDLRYLNRLRNAQCLLALVFGGVAGLVTQAVAKAQARRARRGTETGEPSTSLNEPGPVHV